MSQVSVWYAVDGFEQEEYKSSKIQVTVNGTELSKQSCVKYLGVYIDKDLSWKTHVNHL